MDYLTLLAGLVLVLSPILIPLAVTLAHHARPGSRRVAVLRGRRVTRPQRIVAWRTAAQEDDPTPSRVTCV
jgi:hypothetical protein